MRSKTYLIPIKPIAWRRAGQHKSRFYDTQKAEKLSVGLYIAQQHDKDPKFEGPVIMDVTFFMPIPKTISIRERNLFHSKDPDTDNLTKFLYDTITDTDCVWKDDCIVAASTERKVYDKNPRVELRISDLDPRLSSRPFVPVPERHAQLKTNCQTFRKLIPGHPCIYKDFFFICCEEL